MIALFFLVFVFSLSFSLNLKARKIVFEQNSQTLSDVLKEGIFYMKLKKFENLKEIKEILKDTKMDFSKRILDFHTYLVYISQDFLSDKQKSSKLKDLAFFVKMEKFDKVHPNDFVSSFIRVLFYHPINENLEFNIPNLKMKRLSSSGLIGTFQIDSPKKNYNLVIEKLASNQNVIWIENQKIPSLLNFGGKTVLQGTVPQSKIKDIPKSSSKMPLLHFLGITGKNQIVGIGDSGLDVTNCLFYEKNAKFEFNKTLNHRKLLAYWQFSSAETVGDRKGHGTHTSGSLGGVYSSKDYPIEDPTFLDDLESYSGGAKDSKLVFEQLMDEEGSWTAPEDIGDILKPAHNLGAKIQSESWGYISSDYSIADYSTDNFIFEHPDTLAVFGAGNEAEEKTMREPGTAKNTLSIGATMTTNENFRVGVKYDSMFKLEIPFDDCGVKYTKTEQCCEYKQIIPGEKCSEDSVKDRCCYKRKGDFNDTKIYSEESLAIFSSKGPMIGNRFGPLVVSPGTSVVSAYSITSFNEKLKDSKNIDCHCGDTSKMYTEHHLMAFGLMSGTSMATPTAAGHAVLVRQYFSEGYFPSGEKRKEDKMEVSGVLLRSVIVNSAEPISGYILKYEPPYPEAKSFNLPNNMFGHGQIKLNEKGLKLKGYSKEEFVFGVLDTDSILLEHNKTMKFPKMIIKKSISSLFKEENFIQSTINWFEKGVEPLSSVILLNNVYFKIEELDSSGTKVTTVHWGNNITGGDLNNNVQKIRINHIKDAVIFQISLYGAKVDPSSQLRIAIALRGNNLECQDSSFDISFLCTKKKKNTFQKKFIINE